MIRLSIGHIFMSLYICLGAPKLLKSLISNAVTKNSIDSYLTCVEI